MVLKAIFPCQHACNIDIVGLCVRTGALRWAAAHCENCILRNTGESLNGQIGIKDTSFLHGLRVHVAAGRILRFRDHDQAHRQVRPCVAQLLGSHCLLQQLRCQICVGLRETSTYRVVFVADGGLSPSDDELPVIGYRMMSAFLALPQAFF